MLLFLLFFIFVSILILKGIITNASRKSNLNINIDQQQHKKETKKYVFRKQLFTSFQIRKKKYINKKQEMKNDRRVENGVEFIRNNNDD